MTCTVVAIAVHLWAAFVVAFIDVSYLGARAWWAWPVYLVWPLLPLSAILEIDGRTDDR